MRLLAGGKNRPAASSRPGFPGMIKYCAIIISPGVYPDFC
ncbi:hypothetical protein ENTCAN_09091 [Enterobacter cancerogenus ATCC 35316]|nr:hypothetical protein ENTCAN_09091 [Enterobacter cancerogenus ATCC 35316]